ncbi:MAG: helix-turn-helix domain-containing protein [Anaerolineaceae bacterium]
MLLENKLLSEIEEQVLVSLISNKESESKWLDFKIELPGNSDSEKKRFLTDICAFSNAGGGFIIYGVEEKEGVATSLPGINNIDPDKEILRLENMVYSGIAPRIPGLNFRAINLSSGARVLLIKIPISWASPHMITFEGASRFYSRTSAGNYQLDVNEIRAAFLKSDEFSTGIRNWFLSRVGRIVSGETPIKLEGGAKLIIHFIPIASFQNLNSVDINGVSEKFSDLQTIYTDPNNYRINIDGVVSFTQFREEIFVAYSQLFRDGKIEAVSEYILDHKEKIIYPSTIEKNILTVCSKLLSLQKRLGVEPPIFIYISSDWCKRFYL